MRRNPVGINHYTSAFSLSAQALRLMRSPGRHGRVAAALGAGRHHPRPQRGQVVAVNARCWSR